MRLILPKKSFFIFLIVLLFSIEGFSQTYTITGNVNASSYSCSSFSGYTTISIGNGSTTTKLTMNSDLNLIGSCSLGPLRIIVNNASIDFSTANNRLTLPEGSSIEFLNGGALYPDGGNGGGCTGSDRIYIGDKNIAACQGSSGVVGFDDINDLGGTGTAYSNSPVCVGNPINLTATPPPNGTFTYSWTGPNSFTSTSQYPTFTAISSSDGVYNVVMTRTSDSKKAYGRVTVVVGASITPTLSSNDADNSFCAGTSVMFTAGGGTSYNFKVNGVSVQNGTSTTYTTSTLTNGQVVTVVVSNSSCSVTSSGITNIVNALPSAGLTSNDADNIFCSGTSITFTATGGTSYNFRVGGSSVQNSPTATYSTTALTNGQVVDVIVTNASGCTATSSGISNTVNALPTAGLTSSDADNTFCSGTSVTFTATGGTNYNFRVGGSSVQNSSVSTYTTSSLTNGQVVDVIVTNASGCTATSSGISNTVNALPTAGLTSSDADNTFCSGTSVTFTATGGTNYNFRVGGSSVQNSSVSTYTTLSLTNGQVVDVIVTNASGCTATSSGISNTVNALPTAGLTSSDADNTFCSGTSVTFTATGGTNYNFRVGGSSVQNSSVSTYTTSSLTNGQVVDVIVTNASGCMATSSGISNTVNALPTAGLTSSDADNTFCSGTSVTFTATGGTNYNFRVGGSSVQNSPTATYSTTALTNGQVVDVIVTNASGCTATSSGIINIVNAIPLTPTAGTPTNPSCKVPTGSVQLSGLPSSGTIVQTGERSENIVITGGGTQPITGLLPGTYYFAVTNGGCTSATVSVVIIAPETNTWSGSWSDGTPTINQRLVFASNYPNTIDADIEGCSCQVTGSTAVTIKSGRTLKIENGVEVQPNATLTFENNASLVQINDDAVNSGNIRYHRHTDAVKRYDFTYWSSPVTPQTLKALSPNTLGDKYYSFNPTSGWKIEYNGAAQMVKGNGYIIRAPQTFSITVPAIDTNPVFVGIPNNGVVTLASLAGNKAHLLGNPYPSAIDADKFIAANSASLEGTLYFWTHNTSPSKDIAGDAIYNYTTNDYVTYNKTGGVGISGKIAAGQGFFAPATAAGGTVVFNNAMRYTEGEPNYDNSQFFKLSSTSKTTTTAVAATEKSRVWLNLTNKEGAFKQTLVGYISGATNDYDAGFDGMSYDGNQFVDFYSVNNAVNLSIQGRALPFVKQDSVALGYKSTIVGEFQISIDRTDGALATQNIFLEDKDLKVLHDLKKAPYTFTTEKGAFKNRFVLRYVDKNAVEEVVEPETAIEVSKDVVVAVKDREITINSAEVVLDKVVVYDITGKIIYQQNEIAKNVFVIAHLISSQQLLLVDVLLSDGSKFSTKIIY